MIRWPASNLTPLARENLERFSRTSAAAELANDEHTWTLESWTWVEGPPLHVRVRNEELRELDFAMGEEGLWRVIEAPNAIHLRPQEDGSEESREFVDAAQTKEIDEAVPPGMRPGERAPAV